MKRVSRLTLYVTIYLFLCLLANLTLVIMFFGIGQSRPQPQKHVQPTPAWTPSNGHSLGCDELPVISNLTLIGSGWTKAVYRGWYGSSWVAVKTVHTSGHDITECKAEVSVCYRQCAEKLMQETQMLRKLSHANVIKVFGQCVPEVKYSPGPPKSGVVAVVVELGRPVRVVEVLQMGYEARLQLALDVGRILQLLALSPLGPVLMKDFRREQFVIVDGSLKLSDVDDVVVGDPHCTTAKDCVIQDSTKDATLTSVPCDRGLCRGYNSVLNSIYASQHFMRLLIPYGGPAALEKPSMHLVDQQVQGKLDSEHLHYAIKALVQNYSVGGYLTAAEKQEIQNYVVFHGSTVEGEDFSCLRTDGTNCVQSVSSPSEGASLCSELPACSAFVLLDQWVWTGRQMAVFKTGAKKMMENKRHTLYMRRGQG